MLLSFPHYRCFVYFSYTTLPLAITNTQPNTELPTDMAVDLADAGFQCLNCHTVYLQPVGLANCEFEHNSTLAEPRPAMPDLHLYPAAAGEGDPPARAHRQYEAILGDLEHKRDLYLALKAFGPAVERFFTNAAQAQYLRDYAPHLVQPGRSDHYLGTTFEVNYHIDKFFAASYLVYIQNLV